MAMGKCRECSKEVSDAAKVCPHCGIKTPVKKTTTFTKVVVGLFALGIAAAIFNSNDAPSTPAAPPTPEQQAAKARQELAFQKTVLAAKALRQSLRDPESLTWESIHANDDASIICLEYRAKNGFGGMNKEIVVVANGKVSQQAAAWNKHCTQPLTDMKHVRHAL